MSRCNEIINIRAEINKIENRKTIGKKNPMKGPVFCHSWGFGETGAGRPGIPGSRSHLFCPGALTVVRWGPAVVGGSCCVYGCRMQFAGSSSGTLWRVGATNNRACLEMDSAVPPWARAELSWREHRRTEERRWTEKARPLLGEVSPRI